jgi:hypothetical protein
MSDHLGSGIVGIRAPRPGSSYDPGGSISVVGSGWLVRVCTDCFECALTVFSVPWLREIAKIRAVEAHWMR